MMKIGGFSSTLNQYVLARILAPLALALFIILSALSLERMLRLVDFITAQNGPLSAALKMLFFLQPHYLGLALPAALFLSIMLAVRQMHESSELVVMQAAGLSYRRLLTPVLWLSLFLTVFMIFLTSYGQPYGRYQFRETMQDLGTQGETLRLQPGVFYNLDEKTTLRVDAVGNQGRLFKGFFAEYEDENGTKNVATAARAEIISEPGTDAVTGSSKNLNLTLTNARIVTIKADGSPTIITTQSYPLNLMTGPTKAYGARGQDKREMTYSELLNGGVPGVLTDDTQSELMAEFHLRLVLSLSLPVLAVLAIPMSLIGTGRTGKAAGIVIGVAVLVLYEKTLGFTENLAARNHEISAAFALWTPWFALSVGTLVFLAWKSGYLGLLSHDIKTKMKR